MNVFNLALRKQITLNTIFKSQPWILTSWDLEIKISQMYLFTTRQPQNHKDNGFHEGSISVNQKKLFCCGYHLCSEQPVGKTTSPGKTPGAFSGCREISHGIDYTSGTLFKRWTSEPRKQKQIHSRQHKPPAVIILDPVAMGESFVHSIMAECYYCLLKFWPRWLSAWWLTLFLTTYIVFLAPSLFLVHRSKYSHKLSYFTT